LVEQGKVKPEQKILIQGAGGGVGQVILQVAKALGAYVIGTASGDGTGRIKSLGADEVIDHKHQDFTRIVKDADIVIDMVGGEIQTKSFGVLKKGVVLIVRMSQLRAKCCRPFINPSDLMEQYL
jgi:NADPH:quinone reductase-like Zn-dependent oxidoreductase